jgi:hypothetical protein
VEIKFPDIRLNVVAFTESLADEDYQKRVWVNGERPPSRDCFDDVVHWLFDDTDLADDPEGCIGWYLFDHAEADAARAVVAALDVVLDEPGPPGRPDADDVNSPNWPSGVAAAKTLLHLMNTNDAAARGGTGEHPPGP